MKRLQRGYALVALGVAGLMLAGCGEATPQLAQSEPPVVTVSQPIEKDITDYDQYTGRIDAAETVEVRARVRGELTGIHFKDGALVKAGAPLFDLDPRTYKTVLDVAEAKKAAAEASLKQADAEYQRNLSLLQNKASTPRDVEIWLAKKGIALAELGLAEAEIERARLDLEFTRIKAPIAGKISRPLVTKGNLVNAGGGDTLLTTLVSVDPIYVYFDVDERSLNLYRERREKELAARGKSPAEQRQLLAQAIAAQGLVSPGSALRGMPQAAVALGVAEFEVLAPKQPVIPVFLSLVGEGDRFPREGLIDFAENKLNPATGTMRVRGVFPNPDGKLTPGQFARVRLPIGEKYKGLLVTDQAIGIDQGQKYLLIVNSQNRAEYRLVKPGRLDGDLRIFPPGAGLKAGEWVIVNGVQRVRPGIEVRPERVPMPTRSNEIRNPKSEIRNKPE